jgi:hypothetical protein
MKFKTSPTGVAFDIPDDWWAFAEMEKFSGIGGGCYFYGGQPSEHLTEVIDLSDVEPPSRNTGVPLFKKYKLVPVLFAFTSPECSLPPVRVERRLSPHCYRYRVTNGVHRYYASAAVGYTRLPILIQETD